MPHRLLRLPPLTALLVAAVIASALPARVAAAPPTHYSQAVTRVCAHAHLFEDTHAMGTRAGALEIAADIRASTERRLARVAALSPPAGQLHTVARWIALERRLADAYALGYVRIYDLIAEPRTPAQRPRAALRLARLMHAPDPLRRTAARLEQQLRVPDCTGG